MLTGRPIESAASPNTPWWSEGAHGRPVLRHRVTSDSQLATPGFSRNPHRRVHAYGLDTGD